MDNSTKEVQVALPPLIVNAAKMRARQLDRSLSSYVAELIVKDAAECGLLAYLARTAGQGTVNSSLAAPNLKEAGHAKQH
jgi:hypothetical protein